MACVAGCFAEGCCHRGSEWPRELTQQPLHQLRFWQGVERAVKVTSRGLIAQTSSLHFPFLQEEVSSFLVTPHLELCKQCSFLDVVDIFKWFYLPLRDLLMQTVIFSYLIFPLVIWLLFIVEFFPICQHLFDTQVPTVALSILRMAQTQQPTAEKSHLSSALWHNVLHLSTGPNEALLFYKPAFSLILLFHLLSPFQQLLWIIFPNVSLYCQCPSRSC